MTEIAGSSLWFDRSFVTYSNDAKMQMLAVDKITLDEFGAVSEPVAQQMASNAEDKPVGTVCFSWYNAHGGEKTGTYLFVGNRSEIRTQAIRLALTGLIEII